MANKPTNVEEALARSEMALQASLNAASAAHTNALLIRSLIATLRDNNILSASKVRLIFVGAAALIDEQVPTNDLERQACEALRQSVAHMASGFGVQIPPPGQTGMPRMQ